jgi:hypothetical protein
MKHCLNCEVYQERVKLSLCADGLSAEQADALRDKCLRCNVCADGRTLQVGGVGAVHLDAADYPETILRFLAVRTEPTRPESVSALPLELEQIFRARITEIFDLPIKELLLFCHFMRGGCLMDFSDFMEQVQNIKSKLNFDKRSAWSFKQQIIGCLPWLKDIFIPYSKNRGEVNRG